ncbi:hypothetical protein JZ751_022165, partial [Albula glossodonta]
SPPKPKLTPVKVEVTEGSSVSLSCSAAAPCPKLPPTLTWTPRLSDSEDQLQENQDQTKSVSSVLTFTASHLHHGQKITCTALYKVQQGDTQKTSEASLTLSVPSVMPTHLCRATPGYKVNGTEMNTVETGQNLTFSVTKPSDSGQAQLIENEPPSPTAPTSSSLEIGNAAFKIAALNQTANPGETGSSVTLTCSSNANPPVQNYAWYKVNGTELNTVGTGQNLTFSVTKPSDRGQYYYLWLWELQQNCSRDQLLLMEWRVSGLRVTNSTDRVIREEQLGNTGLRSSLTMRHSQGDTPTLLCLSTNTVGSSSLQLHVPSIEHFSVVFSIGLLVIGILAGALVTGLLWGVTQCCTQRQREGEEHGEAETQTQIQTETQSQAADDSLHYASVTFTTRTNKQESSGAVKILHRKQVEDGGLRWRSHSRERRLI